MNYRFPKHEKLKSQKTIERLFLEGKSVTKFPLKLFFLPVENTDSVKIKTAVSVAKRNFKTAVARNRIKRLLREAYRLNKHLLSENIDQHYAIMILYIGKELPRFDTVDRKMKTLLQSFLNKQKS